MKTIYIDPSYQAYFEDKLLTDEDSPLNRDGSLEPFLRLKKHLNQNNIQVHTADYLQNNQYTSNENEYYSLGILRNFNQLIKKDNLELKTFIIFEPPVVAAHLYQKLSLLTSKFQKVYVHNTVGHGYSLKNVAQDRLQKLHWPMPYAQVIEPYWSNYNRKKTIVVINGNHKPHSKSHELYSKRIEAMASLASHHCIDLYGRDWDKWWSKKSQWLPYWKHFKTLQKIYRGPCASKYPVLSQYQFCLCFENMSMQGYITEKIFDCFYAGTIPLYLGATDIQRYIPIEAFVDCRQYQNWDDLWQDLQEIPEKKLLAMKEAGRDFIHSKEFHDQYYCSLEKIFV